MVTMWNSHIHCLIKDFDNRLLITQNGLKLSLIKRNGNFGVFGVLTMYLDVLQLKSHMLNQLHHLGPNLLLHGRPGLLLQKRPTVLQHHEQKQFVLQVLMNLIANHG